MSERIPPSKKALEEAAALSSEILKNVELGELPLTNITLKASRLARLLNDFDAQKVFEYEAGGYPTAPDGVPPESWRLAVAAGRKSSVGGKDYVYVESITELEEQLRIAEASLAAATDANVSVSSANPKQYVWSPSGNVLERNTIRQSIAQAAKRLASRRTLIHRYILTKYTSLRYSGIVDDVFSRIRERVDASVATAVPDAIQRLTATYDNLRSENPEDWANAVHSCRRILMDLADSVFPPTGDREIEHDGHKKRIRLGKEQYINRLVTFVQESSGAGRFHEIVGSHLSFLGDRLDSVVRAAQKGSHDEIVSREEADRYVVYTYLVVGDILSLLPAPVAKGPEPDSGTERTA